MENKDDKKIVIGAKQYYNLEEVPEPFREMVKAKMEAANSGEETSNSSKITIQKDFQFPFQGGDGLMELLKLLITGVPPAKPRATIPADADTPSPEPENEPEPDPELPGPGAIQPSSSGWIAALAVIALAAYYFFYYIGFK